MLVLSWLRNLLLSVSLSLSLLKCLPSLLVQGKSILLSSAHFLTSFNLSLSPCVFLFLFPWVIPLPFDFPLKFVLSLSLRLPPSVLYCLFVLFFSCRELTSAPSAVIQLTCSLLSPIHSTPFCPSARHRPATLLLTTTLLLLTTLSGLLVCQSDIPQGKAPC